MAMLELCPGRMVGEGQSPFIIAEIGQNHQGSLDIAKKMILAAKQAGADCVKFQKSHLEEKFNKKALDNPYNGKNSWGDTYREHKKYLEFSEEDFHELQTFARAQNIFFTASAMDRKSANFLLSLHVPFLKVGSGDVNNIHLLKQVGNFQTPLVVSTGMADMSWVRTMVSQLQLYTNNFALLQCTSSYPCSPKDVNLRVIQTYRDAFPGLVIGYSGHEEGIAISLKAASLGAKIIERHFTLDKSWKGSDHKCSLDPGDLERLVYHVKEGTDIMLIRDIIDYENTEIIEQALGDGRKKFEESETLCYNKLGKTIVAGRNLKKGQIISDEVIKIKVALPMGIDPRYRESYLGMAIKVDVCEDESITREMLEPLTFHLQQNITSHMYEMQHEDKADTEEESVEEKFVYEQQEKEEG